MARKNYSEEFRRQAVDLYESTPGATVRSIAADLGVERGTLRHWLDLYGTGKKTGADGTATRSPLNPARSGPSGRAGGHSHDRTSHGDRAGETPEQELARLRARVAELEASEKKLTTEREILRSAAKYFAGETNW
jgi:transposase